MNGIPANISETDLGRLLQELRAAFRDAPAFGSISVTAHFVEGRLNRIERGRSESMKAGGGR